MISAKKLLLALAAAATFPAVAAPFSVAGLGFEGVLKSVIDPADPAYPVFPDYDYPLSRVGDFYKGGASASGAVGTDDLGISFGDGDFVAATTADPHFGLGQWGPKRWADPADYGDPSKALALGVNALTFVDVAALESGGSQGFVNVRVDVTQGFNNGLSFYYSSFASATVTALGAGDKVLGSVTLANTSSNICAVSGESRCIWSVGSLPLSETAYAIVFSGTGFQTAIDNLTFGSVAPIDGVVPAPPIPEPSTHAMLAGGLLALAWMARRRRG